MVFGVAKGRHLYASHYLWIVLKVLFVEAAVAQLGHQCPWAGVHLAHVLHHVWVAVQVALPFLEQVLVLWPKQINVDVVKVRVHRFLLSLLSIEGVLVEYLHSWRAFWIDVEVSPHQVGEAMTVLTLHIHTIVNLTIPIQFTFDLGW